MWNKFYVFAFMFLFSTGTWAEFYVIGQSASVGVYPATSTPPAISGPYAIASKKPLSAKTTKKQSHAKSIKQHHS